MWVILQNMLGLFQFRTETILYFIKIICVVLKLYGLKLYSVCNANGKSNVFDCIQQLAKITSSDLVVEFAICCYAISRRLQ